MIHTADSRARKLPAQSLATLLGRMRERAGITIESPKWVLENNIDSRMKALRIGEFDDYIAMLEGGLDAEAEWLALIDLLTVKETRFFRQPAAMALANHHMGQCLAEHRGGEPLTLWSAGCSTGEELYSLAMLAARHCADKGNRHWSAIGTDISFAAIASARSGYYSARSVAPVEPDLRERYICQVGDDEVSVGAELLANTHFFHSNLLHIDDAPKAKYDLIYCQNVLIYFSRAQRLHILDQLALRLTPGGLLILGAGEDLRWQPQHITRISADGVTAYRNEG